MSIIRSGKAVLPRPVWSSRTKYGWVRVVGSARDIDPAVWQQVALNQLKDWRFHEIVEQALNDQFDQHYLLLQNALTGAVATQPIFCRNQDLTAGLPAQFRSKIEAIRRHWPRAFYMKMLMVGSPAAEGYLDCTEPWALEALRLAIEAYARETGCQLIVLKDLPACYRIKLGDFVRNGYQRVPGLPALELELNFASFEDYLVTRLSRVYRKNLRRKFRSLQNEEPIGFSWIQEPTSQIIDEYFRLYWAVYERAKFTFEVLNRDYLLRLAEEIPDKIRLFLWRQQDQVIAFSMCLVHDGILEELYVGFDYQVAGRLHLYFVTWRDVITWCLENEIRLYRSGPLNYDPKLHLRMRLAPQDLYARHISPVLNRPLMLGMNYLGPTRFEPLLKRFSNAHEL